MHIGIEQRKCVRRNREFDATLFTGLQSYALKSFECHDRPRDRSNLLMNVHLRNFIALAIPGVAHINAYLRRTPGMNVRRIHMHVVELEARIAQAEAEWK